MMMFFVAVLGFWSSEVFAAVDDLDLSNEMGKTMKEVNSDMVKGNSVIAIEGAGSEFTLTIVNVELTPKGNTMGKGHMRADKIRFASGILDAYSDTSDRYFAEESVDNGVVEVKIENFAKGANVPVVEHIWGIGCGGDNCSKYGHLVLNPNDPWVSYETSFGAIDYEKLAIGIVMCPEGHAFPLKDAKKGKLDQGKHPELAKECATRASSHVSKR